MEHKPDEQAPDWERIEHDYRAGLLSLREIAQPAGITEGAIRKRAKRDGWERDLNARIHARAEALLVRKEAVRAAGTQNATSPATEREIVEANATRIAQVRSEHRTDITRSRTLAMRLLEELESQTSDVPALAALGEMLRAEDDKGADRLNDLYQKIISLPQRTKTMKDLADTLKTLIGLEREAYGLSSAGEVAASAFEQLLDLIPAKP